MAPLAIPEILPKSLVRSDTILSDSPKGRDRSTIAGVAWLRRISGPTTKNVTLPFFMKADNYLKYQGFFSRNNLTAKTFMITFLRPRCGRLGET
jgi:hypothetical protein